MANGIKQEDSLEQKKIAIIRLMQILEYYTDVDHPLKQDQIKDLLEKNYGIIVERKSIGRNLKLLQNMFEKDNTFIELVTGGRKGSFLDKRLFEDSELRLLIDSVLASKHIPEKFSKDLVEKICTLSNKYFKSRVKHIHTVSSWGKTESKSLFLNIDIIDAAIEQEKKITFDYNKYGIDKKLHKIHDHVVSPYQLVLKNQKYYLMYGSEKWNDVGFIRVDKITNINVANEKIIPIREHKGYENGINYKKITCSLPYMFGDLVENITFVADNCIIDNIVDDFGNDVKFKSLDDNKVEVSVVASPNAMEYWAMQYLKFVEIKSPEKLRNKIKENLEDATKRYK